MAIIKLKSTTQQSKPFTTQSENNLLNGGNYLQMIRLIRGKYPPKYINSSYSSTSKSQTTWFKKLEEDLNRYFSKEDIQMVIRYVKRCLTELVIREMEIKTTMRHHYIHIRMAIIKTTTNNKHLWVCKEKGILLHCC